MRKLTMKEKRIYKSLTLIQELYSTVQLFVRTINDLKINFFTKISKYTTLNNQKLSNFNFNKHITFLQEISKKQLSRPSIN